MNNFWQHSKEQVIKELETSTQKGLTNAEASLRRAKYGPNKIPEVPPKKLFTIFVSQFKNPLIYLLLVAASTIFILGHWLDASVITGVLFFNAIIGTIQEGRAQTIAQGLKHYLAQQAAVIRNGAATIIPEAELVPGDIILLKEGERVPADARILEMHNLMLDESMLTGESAGVIKQEKHLSENTPVHDQCTMVFKGTYLLTGTATAVVTATGALTNMGKISSLSEKHETDMPLKTELDKLSKVILLIISSMCLILLAYGLYLGKPLTELLVMLIALFICVIPEGLPLVFTLALVTGAQRLAQKKVLVKRLQAVEGLARTDNIVLDKTGTLTKNELTVSALATKDGIFSVTGSGYLSQGTINKHGATLNQLPPSLILMAQAASLLSHVTIVYDPLLKTFTLKGDPTDAALMILGQKLGFTRQLLAPSFITRDHIPFDSARRYQAGLFQTGEHSLVFYSGAPEVILARCKTSDPTLIGYQEELLKKGLRVIGLAQLPLENIKKFTDLAAIEQEQLPLELIGFYGIEDSLRPGVLESIATARTAGINIAMATGDHLKTAVAVAQSAGIYQNGDTTLTGPELDSINAEELNAMLNTTTVFARVTPQHKLRLIQAYHAQGKIVAMTGDGVNDAPSLIAADLGIAMGTIGTQVAQEASDMVLLDDSFTSIIEAIKEGRNIFEALRRAIVYFFTTNTGEVLVVAFALLFNWPLPLLAPQILWLNLVTDGFLNVALTTEPQHENLLEKNNFDKNMHLVDKNIIMRMLYLSVPMALGSLALFYYHRDNLIYARTICLTTLALFQWFNAWNCRSVNTSLFGMNPFSNRWLIASTTFVLFLQLLLIYTEPLQFIFQTVPLALSDWAQCTLVASSIIVLEEVRKYVSRRAARVDSSSKSLPS